MASIALHEVLGDSARMSTADHRRWDVAWLLAVAVASVALCAPFLRTVVWLGDEGILIHGAERALNGHALYLDTFSFLPPGGYVIAQAWFAIVGVSLASARVLAIASIALTACFTFLACRESSKSAPISALVALTWVMMSQGNWTQVSYHWLCALFAMTAAWMALRDPSGVAKLLEPIMKVEVVTPDDFLGGVIGDLNSRRGQVQGTDTRGNAQVVTAMVPLANMFGYINTLRSMSQGRAQYSMEFHHYEQVPQAIADEVKAKYA